MTVDRIDDCRAFVWFYSNLAADCGYPTDIYRDRLSAVPPGHVLSHNLTLKCHLWTGIYEFVCFYNSCEWSWLSSSFYGFRIGLATSECVL